MNDHRIIAGIDEAGRGPLAGPIAAAVIAIKGSNELKLLHCFQQLVITKNSVRDSKRLSARQREEIFEKINSEPKIEWRVSFVYPGVIDKINIWQATLLAWRRCLKKLSQAPDFLFLDGKLGIPRLKIKQKTIIKGDQKIFILALASIVAKVSRDRLMERMSQRYPEYGFNQHKGYGTRLHLERLKEFGPCRIHRKSFRPVFENLLNLSKNDNLLKNY